MPLSTAPKPNPFALNTLKASDQADQPEKTPNLERLTSLNAKAGADIEPKIDREAISKALCKALSYQSSAAVSTKTMATPPMALIHQPMPTQDSATGLLEEKNGTTRGDYRIGLTLKESTVKTIPLKKAFKWSLALHFASPIAVALLGALLLFLLNINIWDWFKQKPQYQDIEFTLIPNTQASKPDHATYLAEHNQQAGGVDKTKNKPTPKANPKAQDPEQALDTETPSPKTATAPKPAQQQKAPDKSAPVDLTQTSQTVASKPVPKIPIKPVLATEAKADKQSNPKEATALTALSSTEQGSEEIPPGTLIASTTPPTPGGSLAQGPSGNPEAGPSSDPGVAVMQSIMGPYMSEIKRRLTRNWHPPRGENTQVVVLLFEIGRDGNLVKVEVTTPSGEQDIDEAAINAVKLSAPFKALPEGFQGESVPILFTFDYTVYGSSSRSKRMNRSQ